jgi:hypothetical protein
MSTVGGQPDLPGGGHRGLPAFGGAPTCWLSDTERTVTIDHVAFGETRRVWGSATIS